MKNNPHFPASGRPPALFNGLHPKSKFLAIKFLASTILTALLLAPLTTLDAADGARDGTVPAYPPVFQTESAVDRVKKDFPRLRIPVIDGELKLVYEPDPQNKNKWMVNDHCLIQDEEGNIHYFGIENPFPTAEQALKVVGGLLRPSDEPFINVLHKVMHGHLYSAGTHFRVGHAVASGDIMGSWERLPAALDPQKGPSKGYGSPYVVRHDGKYWMFVPSSGTGIYTSTNLTDWTYVEEGTLWGDKTVFGRNHRDPCVVRMDHGTFFQYFATGWDNGLHTIGLASSKDLMHWKPEEPCYVENLPSGTPSGFGVFESPFMIRHEGLYYLFVGFAHRQYYETFVVVSDNPRRFDPKNKITTVFSHAPELIQIAGVTYMSSCGIEDPQALNRSGLRMCRIRWVSP